MRDLRVSVTGRCHLRCPYCMPADVFGSDHAFLPRRGILTFEEITRVVRAMTGPGVRTAAEQAPAQSGNVVYRGLTNGKSANV